MSVCGQQEEEKPRTKDEQGGGLFEGSEEEMIELLEFAACHERAKWGSLGIHPSDGDGADAGGDIERHSHATGGLGALKGKQDRTEELINEIAAHPTDGDLPLEGPNLFAPSDEVLDHGVAEQVAQQLAMTVGEQEGEPDERLSKDEQGGGVESLVQDHGRPCERAPQQGLRESSLRDLRDEAATFKKREDGVDLKGQHGGQNQPDPGKSPGDGDAGGGMSGEEPEAGGNQRRGH